MFDLAKVYGTQAAGAHLQTREAKLAGDQAEIRELQSKKVAAQIEVSPEALAMARGQIETASQTGDICIDVYR